MNPAIILTLNGLLIQVSTLCISLPMQLCLCNRVLSVFSSQLELSLVPRAQQNRKKCELTGKSGRAELTICVDFHAKHVAQRNRWNAF